MGSGPCTKSEGRELNAGASAVNVRKCVCVRTCGLGVHAGRIIAVGLGWRLLDAEQPSSEALTLRGATLAGG